MQSPTTTADQLSYVLRQRRSSVNIGPAQRGLSLLAGGALAAFALRKRSPLGGAAAVAGAALLYRGMTGHCSVYEAMRSGRAKGTGRFADAGSDTRQRLGGGAGVLVEESISIRRSTHDVYRFWRELENLPRFMTHLESVTMRRDGTSHWVARGPGGMNIHWDARIINEIEDSLIGWQSLDGATIATAGSVNFVPAGNSTLVRVRFQYAVPAGRLGARIASMLGDNPAAVVRDDLQRLKAMLEVGDASVSESAAHRHVPRPALFSPG
jgi:uncharacterized membrane protein